MNYWQNDNSPMARWSQTATPGQSPVAISNQDQSGYIKPSDAFRGDQGASDLLGKLSRAQWEDWRKRFAPYISTLADMATDERAPGDAARMAKESVGTAFDNSQQGLEMQRRGLGVDLTPQQKAAEKRGSSLQRSASMVTAGNQARMSAQDRQQSILAGGMGLQNIPDRVLEQ